MALVGRSVADVAVGRGEQEAARVVQRPRQLLVRRVARDRRRPEQLPGRHRELHDVPVGLAGVDRRPIRVGERRHHRDLRRPGVRAIGRRRVAPEQLAVGGVDRLRLAVGRGDEEDVVGRAANRHAVEVDRRGVDRPVEPDDLAAQRAGVRSGDPGRRRADPRAEARPVGSGRRNSRRCASEQHAPSHDRCEGGCELRHRAARSDERAHGPGGVSSDSAWRYASPASGRSAQRSKQK